LFQDNPGRPVPEETLPSALAYGCAAYRLGFPTSFLLDFYGAGEDNGGRGTDSLGGCHPNRTNGALTPTTPKVFYRPDALPAAQPTASKH